MLAGLGAGLLLGGQDGRPVLDWNSDDAGGIISADNDALVVEALLDAESIRASWWTASRLGPAGAEEVALVANEARGLQEDRLSSALATRPEFLSQSGQPVRVMSPDLQVLVCSWAPEWPCADLQSTIGPESGWNPGEISQGGRYCGLLQIWSREAAGHRWDCAWLTASAENNIRAGYELWRQWRDRGFDPLIDPWPNSP